MTYCFKFLVGLLLGSLLGVAIAAYFLIVGAALLLAVVFMAPVALVVFAHEFAES